MARQHARKLKYLVCWLSLMSAMPAHAQFFSPCLVFGDPLPPPCVVDDIAGNIQLSTQLQTEAQKLTQKTLLGENLASMLKIFGSQQTSGNGGAAWTPINPGTEVSYAAAATTIQSAFPTTSALTQAQSDAQIASIMIAKRAAAGDAYATGEALLNTVEGFVTDANTIAQTIGNCSLSARDDFQMNTLAKNLVLRANTALREARAAKLLATAMNTAGKNPIQNLSSPSMTDAATQSTPSIASYGSTISQLAQATTQLQTLQNAQSAAHSFSNAQAIVSAEQDSFNTLQSSASQAMQVLQTLAQQTADQYGVSADTLISTAQTAMAQDTTAYNDPNKTAAEAQAASAALVALEGVVGGSELSSDWIQALINVDDTQKQVAYAQPLASNAQANSAALLEAQSDFSSAVGVDITNSAQLSSAISQAQSQVNQLMQSLANAPTNIQAQANSLYSQIQAAASGTATGSATTSTSSTGYRGQTINPLHPISPLTIRDDN